MCGRPACARGASPDSRPGDISDAYSGAGRPGLSLRLVEKTGPANRFHALSNQVGCAAGFLHSAPCKHGRWPRFALTARVRESSLSGGADPRVPVSVNDCRHRLGCMASSALEWHLGHHVAQRVKSRRVPDPDPSGVVCPGSCGQLSNSQAGGTGPARLDSIRRLDSHATPESSRRPRCVRTRSCETGPATPPGRIASHDFARGRGQAPPVCLNERS